MKKPKLSRKRCSPLPDIYTLFDKTSDLFGKEGMAFLHSLALPENYKIALEGYMAVLDAVRQEIRAASKKVRQLAEEDPDTLLLMTIPGRGIIVLS
jgi:transposase